MTADSTDEQVVADFVDAAGIAWQVKGQFDAVRGRLELTGATITSNGEGRLTSTLMRRAERELLAAAERRRAAGETAPLPTEPMPHSRTGSRRNDELWRRRAEVIAAAWRSGGTLIDALRQLEPGGTDGSYRQMIRRAREWDAAHGTGILDGVGRTPGSPFITRRFVDEVADPVDPQEVDDSWLDDEEGSTPRAPR